MLIFVITFLAWLSFIPESLQVRYPIFVKYLFLFLIIMSVAMHRFKLSPYFFDKKDIFIWIYFIFAGVGLINAGDKNLAMSFYKDLVILGGSLYFLLKNSLDEKKCKIIMKSLVLFSFLVSIIGILEIMFGRNIIYEKYIPNYFYIRLINQKRMMSTLMNSNILGSYLLACAPLAYYFYTNEDKKARKGFYFLIFNCLILSIVLTFSRGSWIASLLALSSYALFINRRKALIFIWGSFFIFTVLVSFLPQSFFKQRFSTQNLANYVLHQHRTEQYFVTFNMLKKHPFAGIGLTNYRKLFDQYSKKRFDEEVKIPDSIYLMHLAETGIIGFSGFFIFMFFLLKRSLLFFKRNRKNRFFLFVLLGFIGLLFNMASFDGFLWHTPFYLFWIFAGILSSFFSEARNEA